MMESSEYIKNVNGYFGFLITELNFKLLEQKIRGNAFYDIRYKDNSRVISISYENIKDYLLVTVFMLQNGEMPDYDDTTKTLRLNQLNRLVIAKARKEEIVLNAEYFAKYKAKNELERKLLKEAKELRLCLKKFSEITT
jgi:sensor histidine kinase YesM